MPAGGGLGKREVETFHFSSAPDGSSEAQPLRHLFTPGFSSGGSGDTDYRWVRSAEGSPSKTALRLLSEDYGRANGEELQVRDEEDPAGGEEVTLDSEEEETTGLLAHLRHCGIGRSEEADEGARCCGASTRRIDELTHSDGFQMMVAVIIILNMLCLAAQADYPKACVDVRGYCVKVWFPINSIFILFFVLELALRFIGAGCRGFFCDLTHAAWNIFDLAIVICAVLDHSYVLVARLVLRIRPQDQGEAILIARALRVLRVLRVVSILRHFSKLRMLVRGLLESVMMVFWIMALVFVAIFFCAIFCTAVIGGRVEEFPADEQGELRTYWGSVPLSMFTLFQLLTLDDWSSVAEMVWRQIPLMRLFFFPYIFVGAFVIMSLLTGVMADHMNDVRRAEERDEHRRQIMSIENVVKAIKAADKNNDRVLDVGEFQDLFSKEKFPEFVAGLQALDIYVRENEARDLFQWFDVGQDERVDEQELTYGLKQLYGGLSPLQLYKMRWSLRAAKELITSDMERKGDGSRSPWRRRRKAPSQTAMAKLEALSARLEQLEQRTGGFEAQVRTFMYNFEKRAMGEQSKSWPLLIG